MCVTSLPWDQPQHEWDIVKLHLQNAFDLTLKTRVFALKQELQGQLQRMQQPQTEFVLWTLCDHVFGQIQRIGLLV